MVHGDFRRDTSFRAGIAIASASAHCGHNPDTSNQHTTWIEHAIISHHRGDRGRQPADHVKREISPFINFPTVRVNQSASPIGRRLTRGVAFWKSTLTYHNVTHK